MIERLEIRKELRWKLRNLRSELARRQTIKERNRTPQVRALVEDKSDSITVVRIIGNDLYPRHADHQSLRNLDFILENETNFAGWTKLFVLNRLFDTKAAIAAETRIRARGHEVVVLPFIDAHYAHICSYQSDSGGPAHSNGVAFADLKGARQKLWAHAEKIRYAMNINGARNAALTAGHALGDWTLVLDGGCFVSSAAGTQITRDLLGVPFAPYVVIPMLRVQSNEAVLTEPPLPDFSEEPQIAIHSTAVEKFDERFPYGLRDKTSLFEKIGLPGPWDRWSSPSWLPKVGTDSPDRMFFKRATASVFRLSSDARGGKLEAAGAHSQRYRARSDAILGTISMLDNKHADSNAKTNSQIIESCAPSIVEAQEK